MQKWKFDCHQLLFYEDFVNPDKILDKQDFQMRTRNVGVCNKLYLNASN